MRVIVTSVIRESVVGRQETGWIREIDWDRQEVVRELPVPPPRNLSSNDNPRGGLRGGRGVKHRDGKLFIANYDTVFVYGPDWRIEREISHPLSADIHEIALDGEAVWLSCSRTDLAIKLDFEGNRLDQWHITDAAEWAASRGLAPGPLDEERDYREQGVPDGVDLGHLNCVQVAGDDLILCLGKSSIDATCLAARFRRDLGVRPDCFARPNPAAQVNE